MIYPVILAPDSVISRGSMPVVTIPNASSISVLENAVIFSGSKSSKRSM